jgi:hypothetical protein
MAENTLFLNCKEQLVRNVTAVNSENNMKTIGSNVPSVLVLMQVGHTFDTVDSTQSYLHNVYWTFIFNDDKPKSVKYITKCVWNLHPALHS